MRLLVNDVGIHERDVITTVAGLIGIAAELTGIPSRDHTEKTVLTAGVTLAIVMPLGVRITRSLDPETRRMGEIARFKRKLARRRRYTQVMSARETLRERQLLLDLATDLRADPKLCVVYLTAESAAYEWRRHGAGSAAAMRSAELFGCRVLTDRIGRDLQSQLGGLGADVADELRHRVVESDGQHSAEERMAKLETQIVELLGHVTTRRRLVFLVDALHDVLEQPMGKWLLDLLGRVDCSYLVMRIDGAAPSAPSGPALRRVDRIRARNYVADVLGRWFEGGELDTVVRLSYLATGGDPLLLEIRCAVLDAAVGFAHAGHGEHPEPLDELKKHQNLRAPLGYDKAMAEAVDALRWLVDGKASILKGGECKGAFDRLAVMERLDRGMAAALFDDLGFDGGELYDWLAEQDSFIARIDDDEIGVRLHEKIAAAAKAGMRTTDPDAHRTAHIAAERCYWGMVDLDSDWAPVPGYAALERYEDIDWQRDVRQWIDHVREISLTDPSHFESAKLGCICLFLDATWWWGDKIRLPFGDDLVGLYTSISPGSDPGGPEWVAQLAVINEDFIPEWHLRDSQPERWERVRSALDFLAADLGLARDRVPDTDLLRRIHISWCSFNGEVARRIGDPDDAEQWFLALREACGDDADFRAVVAFAAYGRVDAWLPADPRRTLDALPWLVAEADALRDRCLLGDIARMYGDARWALGDRRGAFDAYARAVMQAYIYQVDQETPEMAPNEYSYCHYDEMRTRMSLRLDEARAAGASDEADAALARTRRLFDAYWADPPSETKDEGPLAGIVPPLPEVLGTRESEYALKAIAMMEKMRVLLEEPIDALLPD